MSRTLTPYNLHMAKHLHSTKGKSAAERRAAFKHAAALWRGRESRANPDLGLRKPEDKTLLLLALGVGAVFLLPKLLPMLQKTPNPVTGNPWPYGTTWGRGTSFADVQSGYIPAFDRPLYTAPGIKTNGVL